MKRFQVVLILMICLAVIFTGCGNAVDGVNQWAGGNGAPPPPADSAAPPPPIDNVVLMSEADPGDGLFGVVGSRTAARMDDGYRRFYATESVDDGEYIPTAEEQRMIVTTASFSITTEEFDLTMHELNQMIRVSGGFVQQSESFTATEWRGAFANMTVRIPTQRYDDFRDFIMDLGEVTFFSEGGEDVTVQFFDTEARLAILREQEIRIRSFIEHAQNLEEIFLIERELTRISTEIEQLTTVRDRLVNLVSYATIHISISDGAFTPQVEGFDIRINDALSGSVESFIALIQGLVLLIIWIWPLLVIAAIVVFFVRRNRKRRKEAEAFRYSQMQQVYQAQQASQTNQEVAN